MEATMWKRPSCLMFVRVSVSEHADPNPAFGVPSSFFSRVSEVPQSPETVLQDLHPSAPTRHSRKSLVCGSHHLLGNNKSLVLLAMALSFLWRYVGGCD